MKNYELSLQVSKDYQAIDLFKAAVDFLSFKTKIVLGELINKPKAKNSVTNQNGN